MMADTVDADDDTAEAPESIRLLQDALQDCFDDDAVTTFDIALALCIALYYCGPFGENVKLLAEIDDELSKDDDAVKYDA